MVSCIFGIGEIKAHKLSTKDVCLPISEPRKLIFNVFQQKQLIHCQLLWQQSTCFYVHFHIWKTNTGQSKAKSFKMVSLPPTFEAFLPDVLLDPFQICIWKGALNLYPPTLDPAEYGLKPLHQDKTLHHVPLPMNTRLHQLRWCPILHHVCYLMALDYFLRRYFFSVNHKSYIWCRICVRWLIPCCKNM